MFRFLKILSFILLLISTQISFWALDMDISPIIDKDWVNYNPWSSVTKTAKIKNNSSTIANIHVWKTNFTSSNQPWVPKFLEENDNTSFPNQKIAPWITINTTDFTLNPHQEKEIEYTINIPSDATPGWHYGSIMFKNKNSNNNVWTWSNIWVELDYAVLIVLNVAWDVVSKWTIWAPIITVNNNYWNWWSSNYSQPKKDNCPIIDLTSSNYDWKCIDLLIDNKQETTPDQNKDKNQDNNKDDFNVKIDIPFINEWNTHIEPKWKIKLIDENWKVIKWIWKEMKSNKEWAKIWEEIVDYIPINDWKWIVFPNSQRDFSLFWKGFPYKRYDKDSWKEIIEYWTPSEYYTKKNIIDWRVLMPWERVCERVVDKNIKAEIEINYKENNDKDVNYNSAKDFKIKYTEKYIWLNLYVVIPLILILIWLFIWFIIAKRNKKKCINCKKTINKKMKICPYCEKKQD